ncbi:MAG TPA: sigma-70 family RNA polymerase sigma factor [Planctomycetota bacterium]
MPFAPSADELDRAAQAAAAGDRAAFERLYRGTVARVHALARRLLGAREAEEATQEVYLRAWAALPGFRGEARVATWLHRLARNTLINLVARAEPFARAGDEALEAQAERGAATETRLVLEEAIERLPSGARAVFVLHDVEGLLHEEIAARLGCSVGTSKSQLHRARLLLRAALSPASTP